MGLYSEAGDGNRTRTVSLGICAVQAVMQPDLLGGLSMSDRQAPAFTGVNGTLMARRDPLIRSNGRAVQKCPSMVAASAFVLDASPTVPCRPLHGQQ